MLAAPHNTSLVLMLLLTAVAALYDFRTGLIPNRLVLSGLVLALVLRLVAEPLLGYGSAWSALGSCALGALACAFIPFVLYAAKGLGGGDLKLLMVMGVAVGPWVGLEAQLYAFSLGSLAALGYLAFRGTLFRALVASAALLVPVGWLTREPEYRRGLEPKLEFRFGPAIFAGAAVAALLHWSSP